jgi:hypothetical protein
VIRPSSADWVGLPALHLPNQNVTGKRLKRPLIDLIILSNLRETIIIVHCQLEIDFWDVSSWAKVIFAKPCTCLFLVFEAES